jgi:hypothetical protein
MRFTFLCDSEERRILAALARRLERSQSDAVRWLVRNAAQELGADDNSARDPAARPERATSSATPAVTINQVLVLQFNQPVNQNGGVNINAGGNAEIGGDVAGRDKIEVKKADN